MLPGSQRRLSLWTFRDAQMILSKFLGRVSAEGLHPIPAAERHWPQPPEGRVTPHSQKSPVPPPVPRTCISLALSSQDLSCHSRPSLGDVISAPRLRHVHLFLDVVDPVRTVSCWKVVQK